MQTVRNEPFCPGCRRDPDALGDCRRCGWQPNEHRSPIVLPPRVLLNDKFVVGRVLGTPGGFGVTYQAWDRVLELRVAIKEFLPHEIAGRNATTLRLIPHSADDQLSFTQGKQAFLGEARTLVKFDHPNIVRVREYFEQNDTAYLVMDYYDGESLAEYLKRHGGRVGEDQAVSIMAPILAGLERVHARGFLHRDIKPTNIYLTGEGRPVLLDFGSARQAMAGRTKTLSVILTPGYAPFEQYLPKARQGPFTDIYACGATLYQLVTGRIPRDALERQHGPPGAPLPGLDGIGERLRRALTRAMAREPAQRQQSAAELLQALGPIPKPTLRIDAPRQTRGAAVPPSPQGGSSDTYAFPDWTRSGEKSDTAATARVGPQPAASAAEGVLFDRTQVHQPAQQTRGDVQTLVMEPARSGPSWWQIGLLVVAAAIGAAWWQAQRLSPNEPALRSEPPATAARIGQPEGRRERSAASAYSDPAALPRGESVMTIDDGAALDADLLGQAGDARLEQALDACADKLAGQRCAVEVEGSLSPGNCRRSKQHGGLACRPRSQQRPATEQAAAQTPPSASSAPAQRPEPPPPRQAGAGEHPSPPQPAIKACRGKRAGSRCRHQTPYGPAEGVCSMVHQVLACTPDGGPPGGGRPGQSGGAGNP